MPQFLRDEYRFDRRGLLVRSIVPKRGSPYEHRCSLGSYMSVAHEIEACADAGFTIDELFADIDMPHSQIAVAVAFMKERGVVVTEGKRSYPAGEAACADAMIEWHALGEGSPGSVHA